MNDMFAFTDAKKLTDDPRLERSARDIRTPDKPYGRVKAIWRWPNGDEQMLIVGQGFSVTSDPSSFEIE